MSYLQGLPAFAGYFGVGLGFVALFLALYLQFTPHRELRLDPRGQPRREHRVVGCARRVLSSARQRHRAQRVVCRSRAVGRRRFGRADGGIRAGAPADPGLPEAHRSGRARPRPCCRRRCRSASACSTRRRWSTDRGRRSRVRSGRARTGSIPAQPPRRRSLVEPLMWVGAVALIGFPFLRDATADKMVRNELPRPPRVASATTAAPVRLDGSRRRFVGAVVRGSDVQATRPTIRAMGSCRTRHAHGLRTAASVWRRRLSWARERRERAIGAASAAPARVRAAGS